MKPLAALAALVLLPAAVRAQTSFPMVTHVTPTAVQRGTTAEVTVVAQASTLAGAHKVLFDGTGVSAEPVAAADAKTSLKLKVTVAADAAPGVREFRVACPHGVSSLGQLVVVDAPVVQEAPGNNTPDKAQPIPVPSVVCGRTEAAENVDYYRFAAKAGAVLTFEVHGARIQDKIHDLQKHADPLIAVFDATGKELAANDDGYFADPVLEFKAPADGEYRVAVRDAKFDGDARWTYALTVTDRPYVQHLFPLAANPGKLTPFAPVGTARLVQPLWPLTVPSESGLRLVSLPGPTGLTNPAPLVVTPLPLVTEAEPNDDPKQATRVAMPGGANGRVGTRGDLDHFVFAAQKGKAVRLEVLARRFGTVLRSRLDGVLDVMTPDGKVLMSNDDLNGKDPGLVFAPPADGDYVARVRDLNNRGSDAHVYYLELAPAAPDFTIKCDPSKASVGQGGRTAWYVQVTRTNGFAGPVTVDVEGLPKGVTASALTIPPAMTQGCVVLSAAADAKLDAAAVRVVGKADGLVRTAVPVEEIYLPGGGRGRFDVGMPAVAVCRPLDILDVKVKTTRVELKPGEEVKLDVEVVRAPGYDKTLTLDVLLQHLGGVHGNPLPLGVTVVGAKSKTLLGTGSVGHIVLRAAPDAAACADVPVCVQAYVPINFVVKTGYASAPVLLTVRR
ncbi:PPC domain-containing protein [Urbifossiella limnaea]|uniref:Putative subtilase-type serine protease n=1 Tax=Urbifossiella limnaea TaxID=2528023 RepID=A0A517XL65_9BACT|nr:PPC domain-containing protein [Urbifossiella limnaea]QDU18244.1 putative subtilase-type serine protease precursor [Urbifossiella limnaea]